VSQNKITVRLVKGLSQCNPKQRAIVNALGLKRIRFEKTLDNTSSVRGMIKKVLHLVEVVDGQ
jgi:large subunit ribosomal protein L30